MNPCKWDNIRISCLISAAVLNLEIGQVMLSGGNSILHVILIWRKYLFTMFHYNYFKDKTSLLGLPNLFTGCHIIPPPFKEVGVYCFAFVCSLVSRPNGFLSITKDRVGLGLSNLIWWLLMTSKWPLWIYGSMGQRSQRSHWSYM
jgi:hypothetical protein